MSEVSAQGQFTWRKKIARGVIYKWTQTATLLEAEMQLGSRFPLWEEMKTTREPLNVIIYDSRHGSGNNLLLFSPTIRRGTRKTLFAFGSRSQHSPMNFIDSSSSATLLAVRHGVWRQRVRRPSGRLTSRAR